MQIVLYFIYRVKNRRYVRKHGANKTINTKVGIDLPMSEQVRQRQEKRSLTPSGCTVPSLEMRRISCLLRLSLLPEMGQRARIFMSEMQ